MGVCDQSLAQTNALHSAPSWDEPPGAGPDSNPLRFSFMSCLAAGAPDPDAARLIYSATAFLDHRPLLATRQPKPARALAARVDARLSGTAQSEAASSVNAMPAPLFPPHQGARRHARTMTGPAVTSASSPGHAAPRRPRAPRSPPWPGRGR